jgi:hypothetical protein
METIEGQPLEPKACWLRARYVRARRVPGAMATALRGHSGPAQVLPTMKSQYSSRIPTPRAISIGGRVQVGLPPSQAIGGGPKKHRPQAYSAIPTPPPHHGRASILGVGKGLAVYGRIDAGGFTEKPRRSVAARRVRDRQRRGDDGLQHASSRLPYLLRRLVRVGIFGLGTQQL